MYVEWQQEWLTKKKFIKITTDGWKSGITYRSNDKKKTIWQKRADDKKRSIMTRKTNDKTRNVSIQWQNKKEMVFMLLLLSFFLLFALLTCIHCIKIEQYDKKRSKWQNKANKKHKVLDIKIEWQKSIWLTNDKMERITKKTIADWL